MRNKSQNILTLPKTVQKPNLKDGIDPTIELREPAIFQGDDKVVETAEPRYGRKAMEWFNFELMGKNREQEAKYVPTEQSKEDAEAALKKIKNRKVGFNVLGVFNTEKYADAA